MKPRISYFIYSTLANEKCGETFGGWASQEFNSESEARKWASDNIKNNRSPDGKSCYHSIELKLRIHPTYNFKWTTNDGEHLNWEDDDLNSAIKEYKRLKKLKTKNKIKELSEFMVLKCEKL